MIAAVGLRRAGVRKPLHTLVNRSAGRTGVHCEALRATVARGRSRHFKINREMCAAGKSLKGLKAMTPAERARDVERIINAALTDWHAKPSSISFAPSLLAALSEAGLAIVPVEPTGEMLNAARDWSYAKYGKPVGNDGASGCWQAMLRAFKQETHDE